MRNYEKVKTLFIVFITSVCALAGDIRQEAVSWSRQQRIEKENKYNVRAVLYQKNAIKLIELTESWNGHKICRWSLVEYGNWPDGSVITMKSGCQSKPIIEKIFHFINYTKNKLAPNPDIILDDNGLVFSVQSRTSEIWVRANASDFSTLYKLLDAATN